MITRWLPLYLRSRHVPVAAPISLAAVATVALLWSASASHPEVDPSLAALTVMLALAPLIPTLAGDDDALEKTASLPWPPRRALHLIGVGVFVAAMLLGARATGADFGPAGQVIRNCAGLAGLIGLGVALVGTRRAWAVPITWSALQAMLAVPGGPGWRQSLLWLIQPPASMPASITAAALLLAGVVAYATESARRRWKTERVEIPITGRWNVDRLVIPPARFARRPPGPADRATHRPSTTEKYPAWSFDPAGHLAGHDAGLSESGRGRPFVARRQDEIR